MYFHDKTNKRDTRRHDFAEAEKGLKSNNKDIRRLAKEAGERMSKESKSVRSMRESLVKAHRDRNHGNIRDINHYIAKKNKYQNK